MRGVWFVKEFVSKLTFFRILAIIKLIGSDICSLNYNMLGQ